MDKEQVIELLRDDMRGEHQAIIQYLFHAYNMEEGEITCEVEAIAREEMRHLDWLADAIMELGGDPSLERAPVDFTLASPHDLLVRNVDLEQVAIDQYREHIAAIDDDADYAVAIRRLLGRILHDELVHKEDFVGLADEAQEEGVGPAAPAGAEVPKRVGDILNQGIRHEYTVILQYLYHSFVAEDKELAEELMNSAINEMQHMGWLSEALGGRGGSIDMSHMELFLSRDPEANLEADIAVEQEVTGDYSSQIPELEDTGLAKMVERIRDHEIYHDALFKDLLAEVREEREHEGAQADTTASEDSAEAPEPEAAPAKPPTIPTVGSLKHK